MDNIQGVRGVFVLDHCTISIYSQAEGRHTTRNVDFASALRDHLDIDPRFRQRRKHHTSTSDGMTHILSDER